MSKTSWGTQFEIVANTHRRRLLVTLHEHNPQYIDKAIVENLQVGEKERDELAEMQAGKPPSSRSERRKRVGRGYTHRLWLLSLHAIALLPRQSN